MAEEIFGNRRNQSMEQRVRRRRGNHFASFTKKFSLGNGPPDWCSDCKYALYTVGHIFSFVSLKLGPSRWLSLYRLSSSICSAASSVLTLSFTDLITKEGGKMLGTLVALAIARMRSLESFTWDMPTGILSAVWDSLSSLDDHEDNRPCRLERVAVRWHDNYADPHSPIVHTRERAGNPNPSLSDINHVENPSFSILPPLKSLSVLDIDEVQYLDELSVLIHRSADKLRELRIGIANLAKHKEFNFVWEGDDFEQVDRANPVMSCITIGEKRLGGILGILVGMIYDLRYAEAQTGRRNRLRRRTNATIGTSQINSVLNGMSSTSNTSSAAAANNGLLDSGSVAPSTTSTESSEDDVDDETSTIVEHVQATPKAFSPSSTPPGNLSPATEHTQSTLPHRVKDAADTHDKHFSTEEGKQSSLSQKLSLETFELEDVQLSVPIMLNVIDWSVLTTLTLLRCINHDHLWKALRRQFSSDPPPTKQRYVSGTTGHILQPMRKLSSSDKTFKLNLKHIHTDTVSHSLISFVKETLRPNSLESVFFLHSSTDPTSVSLDAIFNGVIRRHRTSLRKLLVDSGERGSENLPGASVIWRQWMFNREIIKFLGKMPCLKELGAALDSRDWVCLTKAMLYALNTNCCVSTSSCSTFQICQSCDRSTYLTSIITVKDLMPENTPSKSWILWPFVQSWRSATLAS